MHTNAVLLILKRNNTLIHFFPDIYHVMYTFPVLSFKSINKDKIIGELKRKYLLLYKLLITNGEIVVLPHDINITFRVLKETIIFLKSRNLWN